MLVKHLEKRGRGRGEGTIAQNRYKVKELFVAGECMWMMNGKESGLFVVIEHLVFAVYVYSLTNQPFHMTQISLFSCFQQLHKQNTPHKSSSIAIGSSKRTLDSVAPISSGKNPELSGAELSFGSQH